MVIEVYIGTNELITEILYKQNEQTLGGDK